jgi:hypothetical protein
LRWGLYTLTGLRSFLAFKQECRPTARRTLARLDLVKVIVLVLAIPLY